MSAVVKGSLFEKIEPLLKSVERPSRYLGCEWNAPRIEERNIRVALAYPDVYEIGIGNIGLQILQEIVNNIEYASAERVYSPWVDMEKEMRKASIPLFALETHRPVSSYDIFGISIPHELSYTNILNLIDLAGIPLRSSERREGPIVIGGGCGASNPEPLSPFFDLVVLGEGEDVLPEIVHIMHRGKQQNYSRERIISELSMLDGVYRPSSFEVTYFKDGRVKKISPRNGVKARVRKRVADIDQHLRPEKPIVSFCEAVHDRAQVEIFRGCTRGCRFCHAGMVYRPVRERSLEAISRLVEKVVRNTGQDEVSLCSLSSTDYTDIENALNRLRDTCEKYSIELTLPSLRMDGYSTALLSKLGHIVSGGFTFAPEAGTARLRNVINKPIGEKDMIDAVVEVSKGGRRLIKLYFMIGLPTETEEDVKEIVSLVHRLRDAVRACGISPPSFNISVSTFVPKPHTPFQWYRQEEMDSIGRKQRILINGLRTRAINLSWHDKEMSTIEGLMSRGDRRLAEVVEEAWRAGARFDSWSEHFSFSIWEEALEKQNLTLDFYISREREKDEIFPWDHLDYGLEKEFLYEEYEKAMRGEVTQDCRMDGCKNCGVCSNLGSEPVLRGDGAFG